MIAQSSVGRRFVAMGICLILLSFGAYAFGNCHVEDCEAGGTCAGQPPTNCVGTCDDNETATGCIMCECHVDTGAGTHCNCIWD